MNRDPKSGPEIEFETNGSGEKSSMREAFGWSRREFLANSTALAAAGALGGLAGRAPLSAREITERVNASIQAARGRAHVRQTAAHHH